MVRTSSSVSLRLRAAKTGPFPGRCPAPPILPNSPHIMSRAGRQSPHPFRSLAHTRPKNQKKAAVNKKISALDRGCVRLPPGCSLPGDLLLRAVRDISRPQTASLFNRKPAAMCPAHANKFLVQTGKIHLSEGAPNIIFARRFTSKRRREYASEGQFPHSEWIVLPGRDCPTARKGDAGAPRLLSERPCP